MADTEVNPMPVIIVRTQWNPEIIDALEKGCVNTLRSKGFDHIRVLSVPGAVEIPFAVNQCWNAYKYRDDRPGVFIVLGCVIKEIPLISTTCATWYPKVSRHSISPSRYPLSLACSRY